MFLHRNERPTKSRFRRCSLFGRVWFMESRGRRTDSAVGVVGALEVSWSGNVRRHGDRLRKLNWPAELRGFAASELAVRQPTARDGGPLACIYVHRPASPGRYRGNCARLVAFSAVQVQGLAHPGERHACSRAPDYRQASVISAAAATALFRSDGGCE